jgi:hypothetical protein
VTATKLQSVNYNPYDQGGTLINPDFSPDESSCVLGADADTGSNCVLLEVAGGVTIALGLVVGIIQCFTCHMCGLGGVLDVLFATAGALLWAAVSVIVTRGKQAAEEFDSSAENDKWREVIVVMSYVEAGMFGLIAIMGFSKCCCGGRRK